MVLATVDLYLSQLAKEVNYLPRTVKLFFRSLVLHERGLEEFHFDDITPNQQECRIISRYFMTEWILKKCFSPAFAMSNPKDDQSEIRLTTKLIEILLYATFNLCDFKTAKQLP